MKKITLVLFALLLTSALTSCKQEIFLHQPEIEITQIHLLYGAHTEYEIDAGHTVTLPRYEIYGGCREYEILYTVEGGEVASFMDVLLKNKLYKRSSPDELGGNLVIQIVYADGSIEILGDWSVGYQTSDELEHDGWYYLDVDVLYDLFSDYVDMSNFPLP